MVKIQKSSPKAVHPKGLTSGLEFQSRPQGPASRQSAHLGQKTGTENSLWHSWPLARTEGGGEGAFSASGNGQELESFAFRVLILRSAQLFLCFVVWSPSISSSCLVPWKLPFEIEIYLISVEKCSLCVKYKVGTKMSQRVRDVAQLVECLLSVQVSLESTPQTPKPGAAAQACDPS